MGEFAAADIKFHPEISRLFVGCRLDFKRMPAALERGNLLRRQQPVDGQSALLFEGAGDTGGKLPVGEVENPVVDSFAQRAVVTVLEPVGEAERFGGGQEMVVLFKMESVRNHSPGGGEHKQCRNTGEQSFHGIPFVYRSISKVGISVRQGAPVRSAVRRRIRSQTRSVSFA